LSSVTNRPRSQTASSRSKTTVGSDVPGQADQRFNQLVAEVRLLEAYYQEVELRQQTANAALVDARAAMEALSALSTSSESDLLVPIGGGILLPAKAVPLKKIIVNVGANVAIEKTPDSARTFLQNRQSELEKALTALEQQRRELAARLEASRQALQQMAQQ
jgi:prefoldin alpha subunit